ncbi:snRNA-activating protein complex subunit 4 [Nasonia vitripennis]|uniref:snRNA-activating protein complex subunit 4 n=1 Tax=Nasonia vitripennis TaxID=7425 RepID=A0A7M7Q311_NASVI|nr:snRNA-activating protein complex subunit 4 [Nasonia vitripennis]
MSDDEDNQSLLDEIQALDNILSQKQVATNTDGAIPVTLNITQNHVPKQEGSFASDYHEEKVSRDSDEESVVDDPSANYSCNDLQDLLELNKKLIESVLKSRDKMVCLLDDCVQKQEVIKEQIGNTFVRSNKIVNLNAGMPYFKDKNYYSAKRNEDTETKIRNNELRLTELQRIHRWNHLDKNNLLKAIRHEVTLTVLKKSEDEINIESAITKTSQLPSDVKEAIGSLGSIQFDWMKIANNIPENKHTAEECEVMWNNFLHPKINKQKWTSKENKNLNRIVEQHDFENWDAIAKDLGTNRSGYQCFIRYNTNNWKNLMKGQTWSYNDDKTLAHLVSKLKIGDYIPWGYIASCMSNWTKQQVYFRWIYSLAPHLKKGRFSKEEDQQLLKAVEKYGENFSKIAALAMPNRTNIQLKEHYLTLTMKLIGGKKIWTLQEDEKLIALQKKYGQQWVKIVRELPGVTRVQARQRYSSILRYQKRGIKVHMIDREERMVSCQPEHTVVTYTNNTPWSRENKEIFVKHMKVDDYLINFFKREKSNMKLINWNKAYNPVKLREDTKKLFNSLTQLNANLDILSNFEDDFDSDETNQQLLSSLQDYINEKQNSIFSQEVKLMALRMCGSLEAAPERERFIPPLPFGFCAPKSKIKNFNTINYTAKPNEHQRNKMELEMFFTPNLNVTEYLGEDIDNQFEKLKNLFISSTKTQKRVYSLKCKQFAKTDLFVDSPEDNIIKPPTYGAKKIKYDWELNQMISEDSTTEKIINVEEHPLSLIEPNRAMLQAYQEILLTSASFPSASNEIHLQYKLSHKGREALHLFKKRYEQLFQIPAGLSRIVPPDTVDESAFLPIVEKLKHKKSLKTKRLKSTAK